MTISVLLADDQALVRMAFRTLLNTIPGITVVGEAADGDQGVDMTRRTRPDVVLMDVRMPGTGGIEAKDVLPTVLNAAIRAVASGDAVLTPRITRGLMDRFAQIAPWPSDQHASTHFAQLTPREQEVFHLTGSGMSNAGIAGHLVLTEATVKTHITRILAKLQLRDRVQTVIFAYEHRLRGQAG